MTTYQVLTWRPNKEGPYPHFSLFHKRNWGLIIYDEVHMLPAPVFRVVAELQAVRRVGLTATLVREDGCEGYVFSLVGPKRYTTLLFELFAVILFSISLYHFTDILAGLTKSTEYFVCLIPVLIILSLIFTPVFLNLSIFKPIQMLFPSYYYLTSVYYHVAWTIYVLLNIKCFTV